MSSTPLPLVKRRRLDDSSSALRKPFVSPLRTNTATGPHRAGKLNTYTYTPSIAAHTITTSVSHSQHAFIPSVPASRTHDLCTSTFTPLRTRNCRSWSTSKKRQQQQQSPTASATSAARKSMTALELQIRKVRDEIETLQRAAQLSASTADRDLAALIERWRSASQAAAEELFGTVHERVCRMGGVAAWREAERRKHERTNEFARGHDRSENAAAAAADDDDDDADCEFDSEGEELPVAEQEYRKRMKRQARREMHEAAEPVDETTAGEGDAAAGLRVWQEEGRDDDTFTMDMMLRSANIDLDVIGYDQQGQRWTG